MGIKNDIFCPYDSISCRDDLELYMEYKNIHNHDIGLKTLFSDQFSPFSFLSLLTLELCQQWGLPEYGGETCKIEELELYCLGQDGFFSLSS